MPRYGDLLTRVEERDILRDRVNHVLHHSSFSVRDAPSQYPAPHTQTAIPVVPVGDTPRKSRHYSTPSRVSVICIGRAIERVSSANARPIFEHLTSRMSSALASRTVVFAARVDVDLAAGPRLGRRTLRSDGSQ